MHVGVGTLVITYLSNEFKTACLVEIVYVYSA